MLCDLVIDSARCEHCKFIVYILTLCKTLLITFGKSISELLLSFRPFAVPDWEVDATGIGKQIFMKISSKNLLLAASNFSIFLRTFVNYMSMAALQNSEVETGTELLERSLKFLCQNVKYGAECVGEGLCFRCFCLRCFVNCYFNIHWSVNR